MTSGALSLVLNHARRRVMRLLGLFALQGGDVHKTTEALVTMVSRRLVAVCTKAEVAVLAEFALA